MIRGTVALPIWNSKKIAWLALESLCRQVKPENGWELIVFEEVHPAQVGEIFIREYEPRLKQSGCERIVYISSRNKFPLSKKWVIMANIADSGSEYFCLQGADDYSHSYRLIETELALKQCDWCVTPKGYFYDFNLDKVIEYSINTLTGMHMAVRTEYARIMPMVSRSRGVDGWYVRNLIRLGRNHKGTLKCYMSCSEEWRHILCTNGLNNISTERYSYFTNARTPFYDTDVNLSDIVPENIYIRLKGITKSLKTHDDLG
jgi:hypothetical protein